MTRTCWRPLAAWLALAVAGAAVQAQELLPMPGCCAKAVSCGSRPAVEDRMVQESYPIGPLLHAFGCCPSCPDLLIKFMTQCVAPESWSVHGGRGTMSFCPMRMALVVHQTPEVQKQVGALLKAMDQMAAAYVGPMSLVPVGLPIPPPMPPPAACAYPPEKSAHSPEPKQHFRFVLDNLRIRTDDKASVTIKRVEIEYAGDGIDADVAKCAITLGGSEKKADKGEVGVDHPTPAAGPSATCVPYPGPPAAGPSATCVPYPGPCSQAPTIEDAEKAEGKPDKCDKAEEKSDKAESKKVEEEEDHED